MTPDLQTERVYSGFGTSKTCHLLTYLLTWTITHLLTAPDPHRAKTTEVVVKKSKKVYATAEENKLQTQKNIIFCH